MYVATVNVPGYLPVEDEPATFDTAREAWAYLASERVQSEQEFADLDAQGGFTATANILGRLGEGEFDLVCDEYAPSMHFEGVGAVFGNTPGYDGEHDLGFAYCVSLSE